MKPTAKPMGYWVAGYDDPNRQAEVLAKVAPMEIHEIAALTDYMANGTEYQTWRGYASCRVCGQMLGTRCLLTPDAKFFFPEKWEHYILSHDVRPDEDFIKAALEWVKNPVHWDTEDLLKAIHHADDVRMTHCKPGGNQACADEHTRLATWLRELYHRRGMR